jgi:hypothetical protein
VISIIDQRITDFDINCLFARFNDSAETIFKTRASIEVFPENYKESKIFSAAKISCFVPKGINLLANYVKLSILDSKESTNLIKIERILIKDIENSVNSINVCVRPLWTSHETSLSSLIEFIAYYRINGINKFYFYDLDTSHRMKSFLKLFPFVELLSFKMKIKPQEIHASGQMAAINDCLLRNINYQILFVDIDEFIVTQKHETIKDYINQKLANKLLSGLVVPNIFFCHQFQNSNTFPRILSHNMRQKFNWKPGDRSKIIVLRPSTIRAIGIHKILSTIEGFISENVRQSEVLLHHYRSCCHVRQEYLDWPHLNLYFNTLNDDLIEDKSMHRFRNQLLSFISNYVLLN